MCKLFNTSDVTRGVTDHFLAQHRNYTLNSVFVKTVLHRDFWSFTERRETYMKTYYPHFYFIKTLKSSIYTIFLWRKYFNIYPCSVRNSCSKYLFENILTQNSKEK